ncbi:2-(hydroxymethyl)glutarate dehydrogenase Hgd (plasmid) [Cupriavidus necator N-1]|uniref:2-(Hydroxymethyl)glutarate dehydrogenase Hgd n=1 Tax=Cupriavidus necator (strain ATCC 43291 / DSM 13513 / CCUG 52238 / LMG 8453 / N-1) TaxID=1042878 RepID=F8GY91_CUPNN|nr:NAD(P)-dependent oxidoreductase [Cupriavidus necator]AEI82832.1 2-(hydroxymethyl)glutarate dehydrogenase Hgd [Cupriavidus necator N-1]MDX6008628.1 NAD(P)-dependent oxidoreductase [Cupriavidus necator]
MNIGWIGAGKMGMPMMASLLAAGHAVRLYEPANIAREQAQALGATRAQNPADAARDAHAVFSSLPDDAALLTVAPAVFEGTAPGVLYVDTSTVSPQASATVARAAEAAGVSYLRAPVSGTPVQAHERALTTIVSGPRDAFEAARLLLSRWGPNLRYVGEQEQARSMKLVLNLMVGATAAMMAEALALGSKGGIRWDDLLDVMASSALASPLLKVKAAQLRQRDFSPLFSCAQMAKDLRLILAAGSDADVPLPLAALVSQLNAISLAHGRGGEDYIASVMTAEMLAAAGPVLDDDDTGDAR